jgi:hypothetical protein
MVQLHTQNEKEHGRKRTLSTVVPDSTNAASMVAMKYSLETAISDGVQWRFVTRIIIPCLLEKRKKEGAEHARRNGVFHKPDFFLKGSPYTYKRHC